MIRFNYFNQLLLCLSFLIPSCSVAADKDQPLCVPSPTANQPQLPLEVTDVKSAVDYMQDYCAQNEAAVYPRLSAQIEALPSLKKTEVRWEEYFEKLQVLDASNQMSCTGHSIARAMALTAANLGESIPVPSPEFLYDMGASYFSAVEQGKVFAPLKNTAISERHDVLSNINARYNAFQSLRAAGQLQAYPGANIGVTLDYLSATGVTSPPRTSYQKHFQGLSNSARKSKVGFIDFPPFAFTLRGLALHCFASGPTEQRLKKMEDFTQSSYLAGFDFKLVDRSLEKGYFPMLTINTDALNLKDDGEISYSPHGSVSHAFTVVSKGQDAKGVYYETLDSWADENMKKRDKNFKMKKYKIYQSNLEKKITEFSLMTSF